jgi:murein DD-endopeptidase MepM/ murein hydrolase activator NlpD
MQWPVIDSYTHTLPTKEMPGAFWENRGDRWHCGVDIHAPKGGIVVAATACYVMLVGEFTSPKAKPYWNLTRFVLALNDDGRFVKYAELDDIVAKMGERLVAGQLLGTVGETINTARIDDNDPEYIRHIPSPSMLHLEIWSSYPVITNSHYHGGNWLLPTMPDRLLDPTVAFGKRFSQR